MAIVDYGMGNLFSVKHACQAVDLDAAVTSSKAAVIAADAVILPGIGAFGDAMATLQALDLVGVLEDTVASGKPLLGVCLGMQLLLRESFEFGRHRGLGLVDGEVVRLAPDRNGGRPPKVPQVGWNRIHRVEGRTWQGTLLEGLADGEFMYFVHSYYASPAERDHVVSITRYGSTEFCSSLGSGNVFGCQFHPERSGPRGLAIYRRFAARAAGAQAGASE